MPLTQVRAFRNEVKSAKFTGLTKNGTHELIAAVAGKEFRVVAGIVSMKTAGNTAIYKSVQGVTETPLTGAVQYAAGQAAVLGKTICALLHTEANAALKVTLGNPAGAPTFEGVLRYVEV